MPACTWTELFPATTPTAIDDYGLAWDISRDIVIRAGGNNPGGGSTQAETWDGVDWGPDGSMPIQRRRAAVAYDIATNEVVVFGGVSSGTRYNTTHTRGASWALESPATSPGNRAGALGAYCAALGEVVIFGGWNGGSTYYDETWSWNGSTWTQLFPADAPLPRENHAICSFGDGVLLFGGNGIPGSAAPYDDTWFFNGTNWVELSPATTPPARTQAAIAVYETVGKAIMFGGFAGVGVFFNDTWAWDGTDWTEEAPLVSPSARKGIAAVWDSVNAGILILGGSPVGGGDDIDDTWLFEYLAPDEFASISAQFGVH